MCRCRIWKVCEYKLSLLSWWGTPHSYKFHTSAGSRVCELYRIRLRPKEQQSFFIPSLAPLRYRSVNTVLPGISLTPRAKHKRPKHPGGLHGVLYQPEKVSPKVFWLLSTRCPDRHVFRTKHTCDNHVTSYNVKKPRGRRLSQPHRPHISKY